MFPFAWMVSTSLKEPGAVFVWPPEWIPDPVRWQNYPEALTALPFHLFFKNTLLVTSLSVIGQLFSGSLVAFSFSRLRWKGRDVLFLLVLATLMLPQHVTMIPRFLIFRELGWIDTLRPLFVPSFFGTNAFYIFLMRQFFMTIPFELDEAARIDGASTFRIYWNIILPLSKPVLGTVAIFSFIARWNEFLLPLIYLNTTEKYTLALGLALFRGQYETQWHYLMAASVVVMVPILVIFFLAQRHFVRGIVFTGIKG